MTLNDAANTTPRLDPRALRCALRVILGFHAVIEIRALKVWRGFGRPVTMSGFFNDPEHAARAVERLPECKGVYWTLNRLPADMLAIRCNRLDVADEDGLTKDHHVARRTFLLVDCDPNRVHPEISSNENEHAQAAEKATQIMADLWEEGWPLPVIFDSGNGYGLWYRIDLPADDEGLITGVLAALSARFSTHAVKIDTAVSNAGRITKLPGTIARKGDDTPERPHRIAQIVSQINSFDEVDIVSTACLRHIAAQAPSTTPAKTTAWARTPIRPMQNDNPRGVLEGDIVRWGLKANATTTTTGKNGHSWHTISITCPFNGSHVGKDAAVSVNLTTGGRAFHCFHDHCRQYRYPDFLDRVEPGWRRRQAYQPQARTRRASDAIRMTLEETDV